MQKKNKVGLKVIYSTNCITSVIRLIDSKNGHGDESTKWYGIFRNKKKLFTR